jgi:hypothetical protein
MLVRLTLDSGTSNSYFFRPIRADAPWSGWVCAGIQTILGMSAPAPPTHLTTFPCLLLCLGSTTQTCYSSPSRHALQSKKRRMLTLQTTPHGTL